MWKKSVMVEIKTGGVEGMCIMHTSRVAKAIVNYEQVVRHDNCLNNFNWIFMIGK
jgi:hypothetical protein